MVSREWKAERTMWSSNLLIGRSTPPVKRTVYFWLWVYVAVLAELAVLELRELLPCCDVLAYAHQEQSIGNQ